MARGTATAAALSLLLVGCSASPPDGSSGSGSEELVYWSMLTVDEPEVPILTAVFDEFEAETGITVNVQWQGRDVLQKVMAGMTTGNVPDLTDQDNNRLQGLLANNGAARDLSGLYERTVQGEDVTIGELVGDKYDPLTKGEDGAYFMLPFTLQPYVWWYNGANVPSLTDGAPSDWAGMDALLGELKAEGRAPLALDADHTDYDRAMVATAIVRAVGPGKLLEAVEDPTGDAWDTPEMREAVELFVDWAEQGFYAEGYDSSKWPAIQTEWAQNKADLLFLGGWTPNETRGYAADDMAYRAFNFPAVEEGGDTAVPVALNGFAIPTKAKNPEAAEQFLAFLYAKDPMSRLTTETLSLTVRSDIEVPADLQDIRDIVDQNAIYGVNDQVPAVVPNFDTTVFQPATQALVTGRLTTDEFIERMKTEQKQYWELNG
ncbi:ABC transporter substrate-binding protein [Agromyces mediolanus]|uniref:ABC transporter substrate-binding protein n=1 Tax=Agromyces mediolanus TaxID=41986 RepID=UPI00203DF47A|nr:ABC transporter substrate-binding protein [Agromyces mediolanus]MCM3657167.1 ABC transporter substrate-binding protein [Agromyces mediolanus]